MVAQSGEAATPPLWQSLVAGSAGGFCDTVVGHPLDTVKVRLQSGSGRTGLFSGLYNGVGSRMAGVVPDWVACYAGYTLGKRIDYPDWVPSALCSFTAGCIAGAMGGAILCPFDAVKIIAQSQKVSTVEAMRRLGPTGLWAGLGATMIWSVPSQGVFYLAYDLTVHAQAQGTLRGPWAAAALARDDSAEASAPAGAGAGPPASPLAIESAAESAVELAAAKEPKRPSPPIYRETFLSACLAGGIAGIAEWTVSLPLDVVKTRVQSGGSSCFRSGAADVYRCHGLIGFYRGFGPVMLRAFPSSAAALGGIYLVESYFRGKPVQGPSGGEDESTDRKGCNIVRKKTVSTGS